MAAHPRLAQHLAAREISTIWSSTLSRASQTAALIADEMRISDIRCDARLAEADAGPWQGLTPTEIEAGWPGYLEAKLRPDGFESVDTVVARVHAGLRNIASATVDRGDPMAIVVLHSGVLRTLMRVAGNAVTGVPNLSGWFVDVGPDAIEPIDDFPPDVAAGAADSRPADDPAPAPDVNAFASRQLSAPALG